MLTSRLSIRVFALTALAVLVGARVPTLQLSANGVASQAEGPTTIDPAVLAALTSSVGFEDAPVISKIRIHPTNPDIVFVAAFNVEARRLGLEAVFARTHSAEGSLGTLPRS